MSMPRFCCPECDFKTNDWYEWDAHTHEKSEK